MRNKNKGQALLIVVMLLATVLTIVLSASYQTITETKITKMEEDSQKALAAAEAGIEYSLKNNTPIEISGLGDSFASFSGQTTIESTTGKEFSTPLINKDQQYTFYLDNYDEETKTFSGSSFTGNLTVYWQNFTANCGDPSPPPALELTLVYNNNGVEKWAYDLCNRVDNKLTPSSGSYNVDGIDYKLSSNGISVGSYTDAKLLIVRSLYNGTKIGFKGSTDLKLQGSYVNSTASTPGKTTKTVRVFHSLPQIPVNFFVTQF